MKQKELSEKTSFYIYELEQYYTMSDVLNNKIINNMPILHKLLDESPEHELFKKLNKDVNFLSKIDLEQTDYDGNTLLHLAIELNDKLACSLIDAGADVNARNNGSEIPLIQAIQVQDKEKSKNLIKKLLDNGSKTLKKSFLGMTPLFILTRQHPDFLETYLDYINLNNQDNLKIIKNDLNKIKNTMNANTGLLIEKTIDRRMLNKQFKNNKTAEQNSEIKSIKKSNKIL